MKLDALSLMRKNPIYSSPPSPSTFPFSFSLTEYDDVTVYTFYFINNYYMNRFKESLNLRNSKEERTNFIRFERHLLSYKVYCMREYRVIYEDNYKKYTYYFKGEIKAIACKKFIERCKKEGKNFLQEFNPTQFNSDVIRLEISDMQP